MSSEKVKCICGHQKNSHVFNDYTPNGMCTQRNCGCNKFFQKGFTSITNNKIIAEIRKKYFSETPKERWELYEFTINEALKMKDKLNATEKRI